MVAINCHYYLRSIDHDKTNENLSPTNFLIIIYDSLTMGRQNQSVNLYEGSLRSNN